MAFVDSAKIFVKGGSGGKGCRSFQRSRYHRHPRPDGGNGGSGGSVVLVADSNTMTLLDFKFRQHLKADGGKHGSSNNQKGADGQNLLVKVPVGTQVKDCNGGFLLRDLDTDGQRLIVASGGKGGKGNLQVRETVLPTQAEERVLLLELKLFADVGIVGFPNSGKSTLISRISQARPKIAEYPFTTRKPVLGVARIHDYTFVVADLPGLIKGAHEGKGLGDRFLKHVERTRVLLHLVDMAAVEGRDPVEDYLSLNREMNLFNPELIKKTQILAAGKMDLPSARANLSQFRKRIRKKVYPISGITGEGIKQLLEVIGRKICKDHSTEK